MASVAIDITAPLLLTVFSHTTSSAGVYPSNINIIDVLSAWRMPPSRPSHGIEGQHQMLVELLYIYLWSLFCVKNHEFDF